MAELNSNTYTIKNQNDSLIDIEKKIDYQTLFFNTDNLKNKVFSDNKLKSLLYSIKYMNIKELPNIISLNKLYNEKLKRFIYKNILLKYHDMSIENHIKIWKLLLNYNKLKEKYDYKKIKEEIEKNPNLVESKEIINLDVIRTYFKKDRQLNREKTSNILKVACKETPSINYCQGMNYIVAFLLKFINEEDTVFYIMMGLFVYTNFKKIFYNELIKLKMYFNIFDRILSLYLPNTLMLFKKNNIMSNYFISPWIITLFTNTMEINCKLDVLIKIFDNFIISGWKTIFNTALLIVEKNEENLLNLKTDKLLHYLSDDILKDLFYGNEMNNFILELQKSSKIKKNLIHNLKKELKIESQILKEE